MDKKRYYVSVQARTIMERQGDAAYEMEIEAGPDEIEKLRSLFESLEEFDQESYFRSIKPGIPYHHDNANDGYDYYLKEIYRLMDETGTEETKRHLSSIADSFDSMGMAGE